MGRAESRASAVQRVNLRPAWSRVRLRGPKGLARCLVTRVARRREELLFEKDIARGNPGDEPAESMPAVIVDKSNVGKRQLPPSNSRSSSATTCRSNGLRRNDLLLVGSDQKGKVVTYAFVLFRTHSKKLLGIADELPSIANRFIEPEIRGRRLYPKNAFARMP